MTKVPVFIKNLDTSATRLIQLDDKDWDGKFRADDVKIELTEDVFGESVLPEATNLTVPKYYVTSLTGAWVYTLSYDCDEDGKETWSFKYPQLTGTTADPDPVVVAYKMVAKTPIRYYVKLDNGKLKNVTTQYATPKTVVKLDPQYDGDATIKFDRMGNRPEARIDGTYLRVGRCPEKILLTVSDKSTDFDWVAPNTVTIDETFFPEVNNSLEIPLLRKKANVDYEGTETDDVVKEFKVGQGTHLIIEGIPTWGKVSEEIAATADKNTPNIEFDIYSDDATIEHNYDMTTEVVAKITAMEPFIMPVKYTVDEEDELTVNVYFIPDSADTWRACVVIDEAVCELLTYGTADFYITNPDTNSYVDYMPYLGSSISANRVYAVINRNRSNKSRTLISAR